MRPILLLVPCLIVGGAGIFGGGLIATRAIVPYVTTRSWVKTRAYVGGIYLHKFSRGGRRASVRCEASYSYVVHNRRYKGSNASVYDENPFGTFQKQLCERLQAAHRAKRDTCWYDASNPTKSAMEKVFVPELMLLSLLVLTFLGTAGLVGVTKTFVRLQHGWYIWTGELYSMERNWPRTTLVVLCYWVLLAVLALPISIDTALQGVYLSLANVFIGCIHICGAGFCAWRIKRGRSGGMLLVPNEMMYREVFTLRLPQSYEGEPRLAMTWLKESDFMTCSAIGKPAMMYPIEMRKDGVSEPTEVDFIANALPEELSPGRMCVLRISGEVGETPYEGTFLFGTAMELREVQTRRELGLSRMFSM